MRKLVSLLLLLSVAPLSADDAPTEDPRWAEAMASYLAGRDDEGHNSLVALVEDHPGDLDLAATCYRTIIREEGTIANTNPWINFASEQILALERLGALSANSFTIRSAFHNVVEVGLSEGRQLQVLPLQEHAGEDVGQLG